MNLKFPAYFNFNPISPRVSHLFWQVRSGVNGGIGGTGAAR